MDLAKADYGRQGLGWDPQARIQLGWVNFGVFLTSRFAPLALSSVWILLIKCGNSLDGIVGLYYVIEVGKFWENRSFWKQLVTLMAKTELIQIG